MAGKSPSAVSKCPPMNLVNGSQGLWQFPFSSSLPWVFWLQLCSDVSGIQPASGRSSGWAACCHLWRVDIWHASLRTAVSAQQQKGDNHEGSHHLPQLVLVRIHSLLSAVIPFQWQCAGCKFLRSYWQAGCGCLENITREMIKIQGSRRKNRPGQIHPGVFCPCCVLVMQSYTWKVFQARRDLCEPILQGWLPDWQGNF